MIGKDIQIYESSLIVIVDIVIIIIIVICIIIMSQREEWMSDYTYLETIYLLDECDN